MNWQLNKIQYPIYNLGEGRRVGIWVQGCTLGCKGCINQALWTRQGGQAIPIKDLFNWLIVLKGDFDGITISGGEPFQQYKELIVFLHLIKTRTPWNVHCFSGYYLHELRELFPDKLYEQYIDTLVDGRFDMTQQGYDPSKGSSNQTVYQFINGIPYEKTGSYLAASKWSLHVDDNNRIYMAGIPRKDEIRNLCEDLGKVGIKKKFK